MLKDQYNRNIDYLRVSITDKCNLRCRYCMPEHGVSFLPHERILRFEELIRLLEIFVNMGIRKVKLTGGEPLVRRGVEDLVPMIRKIHGLEELTLTTNGIEDDLLLSLASYFDGINISLDTLDPTRFRGITRNGDIRKPLRVIEELLTKDFSNLKINMVPMTGVNEDELVDFALLAKEHSLKVRFIELMPIGCGKHYTGVSEERILEVLTEVFGEPEFLSYRSNGPASYFSFPDFKGALGFIRGVDHRFCHQCNRVRLTAEGFLKTCLGFSKGVDLRSPLREGCSNQVLEDKILEALRNKPLQNEFLTNEGYGHENKNMNQIGG